MPLVEHDKGDEDDLAFLDVANRDFDENHLSPSVRIQQPANQKQLTYRRRRSLPTTIELDDDDDDDDSGGDHQSVRSTNSGRLGRGSKNSTRHCHPAVGSSEEQTVSTSSHEGEISEESEGEHRRVASSTLSLLDEEAEYGVEFLEGEVARLNYELAVSRSEADIVKLQHRQLQVEFEDLQAVCQELQAKNEALVKECAEKEKQSRQQNILWPWGGKQSSYADEKANDEEQHTSNNAPKDNSEEESSVTSTEESISTAKAWADDDHHGEYTDLSLEDTRRPSDHSFAEVSVGSSVLPETKRPWWAFGGPTTTEHNSNPEPQEHNDDKVQTKEEA